MLPPKTAVCDFPCNFWKHACGSEAHSCASLPNSSAFAFNASASSCTFAAASLAAEDVSFLASSAAASAFCSASLAFASASSASFFVLPTSLFQHSGTSLKHSWMSSVMLPNNAACGGASGLQFSQDGFAEHLSNLAWAASAAPCASATMSSVTPEVESFACSAIKVTLAEAAAASALAASTNEDKHSCNSDCGSQLDLTFSAAAWASDWAASNASCSAWQPKENVSLTFPNIFEKHAGKSSKQAFVLFSASSASLFAFSTDAVTHSFIASAPPTQCSNCALDAVASSCACFAIKSAFVFNASTSACIFACIFSPHAATSPKQFFNSSPAAVAFASA